jgi:hypothetical protein
MTLRTERRLARFSLSFYGNNKASNGSWPFRSALVCGSGILTTPKRAIAATARRHLNARENITVIASSNAAY